MTQNHELKTTHTGGGGDEGWKGDPSQARVTKSETRKRDLKKIYLLLSTIHNSRYCGCDCRGLLKGFNAATTDEECQILSAKPTDGPTCNTWQETVQLHLLLPRNLFTVGMARNRVQLQHIALAEGSASQRARATTDALSTIMFERQIFRRVSKTNTKRENGFVACQSVRPRLAAGEFL